MWNTVFPVNCTICTA